MIPDMSADGPPLGANCSPSGGSAAAPAASVGAVPMTENVRQRARRIRLVTCDVDGVLTDSRIYVDDHGHEFKAYSALDGHGLKMLMHAGIAVGWITGSNAPAVTHRARQLHVRHLVQGVENKLTPWDKLCAELGLPPEACAHIGDDLPDVPVFNRCGLAVTVPHAPPAVQARAHYVTRRDGGMGAVRELCELILAAQDALAAQLAAYGA
jgi:3-deoxy-D-manno-octulosonate 8-phosphate phosphatase (KDO 8-P phosphatase)